MKTLLLSALALTVAAAPVFGEEQDQSKHPQKQAPPQRHVNAVPRSYTPRVQQQLQTKTQALQNKQNFNRTNTTKTFTPNVNRTRTFTPNQNTTVNANTNVTNQNWRNRTRTNTKVMTNPLNTTVQSNNNTTVRNRNWQNR